MESYHAGGVDVEGRTIEWAPVENLPAVEGDYDWEMLRGRLFEDTVFLVLWRAMMDGIEIPGDEINGNFGIGESLILAHWFD